MKYEIKFNGAHSPKEIKIAELSNPAAESYFYNNILLIINIPTKIFLSFQVKLFMVGIKNQISESLAISNQRIRGSIKSVNSVATIKHRIWR